MKTKFFRRWSNSAITAIGITAILGGCAEKHPLDDLVDATNDYKIMMWRADVAGDFNNEEWHDFDDALQEIKFDVMIEKEASGSEGVRDAAYRRIDGKPVREVLTYGYGLKMKRLLADREKIGGFLATNKKFRTKEGDDESARYLENLREEQSRRVQTLDQQIEGIRAVVQRRGLSLSGVPTQTTTEK